MKRRLATVDAEVGVVTSLRDRTVIAYLLGAARSEVVRPVLLKFPGVLTALMAATSPAASRPSSEAVALPRRPRFRDSCLVVTGPDAALTIGTEESFVISLWEAVVEPGNPSRPPGRPAFEAFE
jgi:hypothetical protein